MKGYSLPELLVVLGILSILGVVVVTNFKALQTSEDSIHAAFIYADALREAQNRAFGMENDTAWGTAIDNGIVVVFSGTSYATRTASRDRKYVLPTSLTVSGATTTVFTKFTGLPAVAATTTFTNVYASSTVTISTGGATGFIP